MPPPPPFRSRCTPRRIARPSLGRTPSAPIGDSSASGRPSDAPGGGAAADGASRPRIEYDLPEPLEPKASSVLDVPACSAATIGCPNSSYVRSCGALAGSTQLAESVCTGTAEPGGGVSVTSRRAGSMFIVPSMSSEPTDSLGLSGRQRSAIRTGPSGGISSVGSAPIPVVVANAGMPGSLKRVGGDAELVAPPWLKLPLPPCMKPGSLSSSPTSNLVLALDGGVIGGVIRPSVSSSKVVVSLSRPDLPPLLPFSVRLLERLFRSPASSSSRPPPSSRSLERDFERERDSPSSPPRVERERDLERGRSPITPRSTTTLTKRAQKRILKLS